MVRAVEGMMKERNNIFYSFLATLMIFQCQVTMIGLYNMNLDQMLVCTGMQIIGAYVWYVYCARIYQRFKVAADVIFRTIPHDKQLI